MVLILYLALLLLLVVVVAVLMPYRVEMVVLVDLVVEVDNPEQVGLETPQHNLHLKEVTVEMVAEPGLTLAVVVAVALPLLVATALAQRVVQEVQELHPQLQAQA
jgi:hypothetical protein